MAVSGAAVVNAGFSDGRCWSTVTPKGDVQIDFKPEKSYITVHVKEAGRPRISAKGLKGGELHTEIVDVIQDVMLSPRPWWAQ